METKFKIGQEVYDQISFRGIKGKVVSVSSDKEEKYPLEVMFKDDVYGYTLDGKYEDDGIVVLSNKPYNVVFEGFE
jgi:hypothetical protein